ncbi:RNA polymerase sigma factor [Phycicoccus sonneratiae]|uniref:RNA polymerase sigma factor n=1 Tax=Phycicoccus sonneratiae TaxID=2807628 RepID=A0ABS2CKA4_9MICO|nr:RNA polymerase sigma factor [Phycicoccus sonneraticus]MBM6400268.1 RNA polymerase sigma factor [Phycicoccus sonneraticus]
MSTPEDRFSALFDTTHVALLGYAVRRVADPADAADVVAETYLVAWRRLDDVPVGAEARPWLFGVARRVLANHYRGERRRMALADRLRDSLHQVVPPPEVREPSVVERAVERLGADDRELLRLLAWEELAREEIALAMGLSRATVRVRLHRARARLRQAMVEIESETDAPALQRIPTSGHDSPRWATARPGTEENS